MDSEKEKIRRYKITESKEKGFDLGDAFVNATAQEHGYVKDSDYYYDSYSHFSMYLFKWNIKSVMRKC
jgi:hypothetical protein